MLSEPIKSVVVQVPSSMPPQAVDAEIAILSAILSSPDAIEGISRLNPDDFYVPAHKTIFEVMRSLQSQGKPCDRFHVCDAVRSQGCETAVKTAVSELERGEGVLYLRSCGELSALIVENSKRRKLIAIASQLANLARNSNSQEAISATQQSLLELRDGEQKTIALSDALAEAMELLQLENAGENAIAQGVQTGFCDLDEIISCLPFGSLSVVGGRGGMGKSTFALDIALRASQTGFATVFFALEMQACQMAKKALSRLAAPHVPANKLFKINGLQGKDWDALNNAIATNLNMPFWINDDPRMTVHGIRAELQAIAAKSSIDFVVVDYIQLLRPDKTSRAGTRTDEIYEILQELRAIAKEFGCVVLGLSQIKRDVDNRQDKRPTLSDFGDSSSFEREAAIALAIYRDEYYNSESESRGIAEILVLKNRFGSTGTAKLLFDTNFGEFKNLSSRHNY
jgi:replicative DNA helicase